MEPELYQIQESRSGERSSTLPRRFTRARLRCHALIRRLAVNGVTFAAFANSSLVIWSAIPPGAFSPDSKSESNEYLSNPLSRGMAS